MNKSLVIISVLLTCLSTSVLADNKQGKREPSPKSEHDITVGNTQAAESGNVAEDKTVKEEKPHPDKNVDHDKNVGTLLDYLDELGIAENTFVVYSTDNGPHRNSWPDGVQTGDGQTTE